MPTYEWKCEHCEGVTEVFRRMKNYDLAPMDDCQGCTWIAHEKVFGTIKPIDDIDLEDWEKLAEVMPDPSWKKVIAKPELILHEDHKIKSPDGKGGVQHGWPIRVPGLVEQTKRDDRGNVVYVKEIVGTDAKGHPVIKCTPAKEYVDVIFHSKRQQDEWLKANGMVRMMDGSSASTGNSEKGRYGSHGGDDAPTERAAKMAAAGRFVESKELYNMAMGA